jgi:hypothetical protein
MDFLKIFLLELYLIWNWLNFLFKTIYLFLVDRDVLHLMPQQSSLVAERQLLGQLRLGASISTNRLRLSCAIDRLLDPMLKVGNLVVDKVLIYFHFFLKVAHFTLVNELENPWACIFDSLNTLFLQVEHFEPDLSLEWAIWSVMNLLPLEMQMLGCAPNEFECLKIACHEGCDEVKSVILMLSSQAVDAYPLLVIKAEEVKLLAVEAAIDWYGWWAAVAYQAWCESWLTCFHVSERALWKSCSPLHRQSWSSLDLRLPKWMCKVHILHLVVDIHTLVVDVAIGWGNETGEATAQAWCYWLRKLHILLLQLVI